MSQTIRTSDQLATPADRASNGTQSTTTSTEGTNDLDSDRVNSGHGDHAPFDRSSHSLATRTIRAGQQIDREHRSISPPIWQSANFRFHEDGTIGEYDYSRSGNPTRSALEEAIVDLEGGAGGAIVGSGMAAITLVLSLLPAGATVVCSHDPYGGTDRLLRLYQRQGKLNVIWTDLCSDGPDEDAKWNQLPASFDLLWIETPSNPLLRITDLRRAAEAAHNAGALLVVDNTFLSPVFQRPLDLGADIVVHSTTKYLNGHSDVIGGAAIGATRELAERLAFHANALGLTAPPFDSWLVLRGLRTLHLRCSAHESNARSVADYLVHHPAVRRVYYPGLASHPGHEIAAQQQQGFGGMISFEVEGNQADAINVGRATGVFALAESLGGVESLIEHPATMSHAAMDRTARIEAGISERLIRLSVGVEPLEDIIADLEQALRQVKSVTGDRSLTEAERCAKTSLDEQLLNVEEVEYAAL